VQLAAVQQRRDPPDDDESGEDDRDQNERGRARGQGVEVERQPAGDEEDRDEDAEADGVELHAELGVARGSVGVDDPEQDPGDERPEDHLEARFLGDRGERDQQEERAAHADLRGGRGQPLDGVADAHRAPRRAQREHHRAGEDQEAAQQRGLRTRRAALLAEQEAEQEMVATSAIDAAAITSWPKGDVHT